MHMAVINVSGQDRHNNGSNVGPKNLSIDHSDPSKPYKAGGGSGNFDVLRNFPWTINPASSREDVVPLIFREWNPKASSVFNKLFSTVSQISSGISQGGTQISNPIEATYIAEPTNISYIFPSIGLGDFTEQVQNTYNHGDSNSPFANIAGSLKNVLQLRGGYNTKGGILGAIGTATISEIPNILKSAGTIFYQNVNSSDTQFFTSTGLQSYNFSLDLLNTGTEEEVKANRELCKVLIHQSTFEKTNFVISRSPCIYSVELENRKWLPACYLTPSVQNLGNFLNIGGEPTPEAYRITLGITELIPQIRTVTDEYINKKNPLSAFVTPDQVCEKLKSIAGQADSGLQNLGS